MPTMKSKMILRSFLALEPIPRGLEFNRNIVVGLFCDSAYHPCRGGELYQNNVFIRAPSPAFCVS
jgi:hypothetical protein